MPSSAVTNDVPYECFSDEARLKGTFTTGKMGATLTFLSNGETVQLKCDDGVATNAQQDERLYLIDSEYMYYQQICEGQSKKGRLVLVFGPTPKGDMIMPVTLRKGPGVPDLKTTLSCKISDAYKGW